MILSICVEKLKQAYTVMRRQQRPAYTLRNDPRKERLWVSCAEGLISRALDPMDYVRYVFEHIGMTDHGLQCPYVEQITSERWVDAFAAVAPTQKSKHIDRLQFQAEKLKTLMRNGFTLRWILLDIVEDLSPLFRYCVARSENLLDVAEMFREAAVFQAVTNPSCSEVYSEWGLLPEELVNARENLGFGETADTCCFDAGSADSFQDQR